MTNPVDSATKYIVNPHSYICTNPECRLGLPYYKNIGKASTHKCPLCGQKTRRIRGEPRH